MVRKPMVWVLMRVGIVLMDWPAKNTYLNSFEHLGQPSTQKYRTFVPKTKKNGVKLR